MAFPTFYFKLVSDKKKMLHMKNTIFSLYLISLITLFTSCGEQSDCGCNNPPNLRPITAGEEMIIESVNNFAFDVFERINRAEPDKNLFISPLSISTALSMTANGAVGATKEGIKNTLHQDDLSDNEINEAYKTLVDYITSLDPKVTMSLANSNWYKEEYHTEDTFRKILLEYYNAEVKAANFNDPATKDLINGWIEDQTNGKIKDMIDQIPSNVVMYLINAIYLKATWQYQFEKDKTDKMDFTLMDGSSIKTDMMFSDGVKASFTMNENLQFIELPYGNGQFVFTILMPVNPQSLDDLISNIDTNIFNDYLESADTSTFKVYLPKFKIEYKITLNEILGQMGMAQSFGGNADFSDLFVEELDLFISRVLHQSFLEVDEEGTEAAAATVVEIRETSVGPNENPSVLLIDRPFAFFIREKHTNTILFSGKLINPIL